MGKHRQPDIPVEIPTPGKHEEIVMPIDPEVPLVIPEEDPDIIPDEETFEPLPYELPIPGEGP